MGLLSSKNSWVFPCKNTREKTHGFSLQKYTRKNPWLFLAKIHEQKLMGFSMKNPMDFRP
jgi:hypothetical protein